jgi:hypothetical protein
MSSFHDYINRRKDGANPMADAAVSLGLPVFPCGADKKPLTTHGFKDATNDPARIRTLFSGSAAVMIGVPTGAATDVVVIDVDRKENRQGGAWLDENSHRMPQTRTIRTASGGLHIYLRHPGQRVKNSNDKIAPGIDVRGDGGYVIVPPSPGYSLADDAPMAEVPEWLLAVLCPPEPVPGPVPEVRRHTPASNGGTPYGLKALEDECAAISRAYFGQQEATLNAAGLKIGALVAGGELEAGPALADLLAAARSMPSQPGKKPWHPSELEKKARRAFEDGSRKPRSAPDQPHTHSDLETHPAAVFLAKVAEKAKRNPAPAVPVDPEIMELDGVLKLFVDHCERTAISPQPFLALAAAICLVGVLAGRKYRTTTDLRTNVYAVGIADSGGGKDHARKQIRKVLYAADLQKYLGGSDIASSAGMRTALQRHPATVFLVDEFGNWLSGVLGDKAPAHKAQIAALMKELYSSANTILSGIEYADQTKQGRPREDIHQPHACLYATSTPRQFWAAVGGANLEDGLMARMLLFLSPQSYPDEQELELAEPSAELVAALKAIVLGQGQHDQGGNMPEIFSPVMESGTELIPYTVPETPEATQERRALRREQLDKQRKAEGTWITSIEGRFAENAMKLALVRAISRDPGDPIIQAADVAWGRAVTRHCLDTLLREAGQNVAETEYEKKTQRLMKIIRQHGPVTDHAIFDRHRFGHSSRERAEMLNDLIRLGMVVAIEPDPSKPGPKRVKYMIAPAAGPVDDVGN